MNLHILPDDKYVENYVKMAEISAPGTNTYIVRDPKPFKFLSDNYNYIEAPVGSAEFNNYVSKAEKGDKIFLHYLSGPIIKWLHDFNTGAKIGWVYWGADFYENSIDYPNFDPLTKKYLDNRWPSKLSRFYLLSLYRVWKRDRAHKKRNDEYYEFVKRSVAKIDYLFHFMKGDYDLVKKYLGGKSEFVYFHYAQPNTFEEIGRISQQGKLDVSPYSKNIWVSNCGYPTGNHLDVFERLKGSIDNDTGICVPLSYGNKEYTEHVIQEGKRIFGDRFIPFTDYISFDTFVRILMGMDVAIMGHNTPWAMGNIVILFYFGKKVYVKDYISSYRWMKENGACIGNYFDFNVKEAFEPQSEECKARNIEVSNILSWENSYDTVDHMLKL